MRTLLFIVSAFFISYSSFTQDKSNCGCCTEKHSEFDFWVGTWNVTNPDGTAAGKNIIEKVQDNCILRENWTSARPGYTGTSQNFFNSKTQQWEQIWVDNQGQSLHLIGNRKGDQMILRTEDETNQDGQTFYHRVTWTNNEDGTVRQLWETITNNEDVSIAFDGLYQKNKKD